MIPFRGSVCFIFDPPVVHGVIPKQEVPIFLSGDILTATVKVSNDHAGVGPKLCCSSTEHIGKGIDLSNSVRGLGVDWDQKEPETCTTQFIVHAACMQPPHANLASSIHYLALS